MNSLPHGDTPDRLAARTAFLAHLGEASSRVDFLAGDASFRKYWRITRQDGSRVVLMDAPPQKEDVRPFLHVARLLQRLGYSAPRIMAEDRERGLLLLEDLGDRTFTREIAAGRDEGPLYRLATDLLADLHNRPGVVSDRELPPYDLAVLRREADLFVDWYLPAIGHDLSSADRADWDRIITDVFGPLASGASHLVLRDYHIDNLLVLEGRHGLEGLGLLDFQDALIGRDAYDLVSLLKDARRDVPKAIEAEMLARYLAARPDLEQEGFMTRYHLLGLQRNLKIIGIFTRLSRRDGKHQYLAHIPRLWRLLEPDLARPEALELGRFIDHILPAEARLVPEISK